jgi:predicted esterase
MITALLILALLSHPDAPPPTGYGDWSDIDFWAMEIGQPHCDETENLATACQVRRVDQAQIDALYRELSILDDDSSNYHYVIEGETLTIYSFAHPRDSFVCCDIQGPFYAYQTSEGNSLSVAQFLLPHNAFFELMLLNNVTLQGDPVINQAVSPYLQAYLDREANGADNGVQSLNISGFDRGIEVFRKDPGLPVETVFYLKDGLARSFLSGLRAYYGRQFDDLPNFALIGIESGDIETRYNEYLSEMTADPAVYARYRSTFSDVIVPTMEARLQFSGGAADRVLVGQSNGGKWVLDYGLDHPEFASHVVSMSPAGQAITAPQGPAELYAEQRYYLTVGRIEGAGFVRDARAARDTLEASGIDVFYREMPAGHSESSWAPFFIQAFEQIVGVQPEQLQ